MKYILSFLEGVITFVSPCLLPMLPVYIAYFAGQSGPDKRESTRRTLINALGFTAGFTALFVALGAFSASLGSLLREHSAAVNAVCGIMIIVFGLGFLGVIKLPFLSGQRAESSFKPGSGFFPSMLFGAVFAVSWTPCVGAFLGSALLLAAQSGSALTGVLMLLCFSLGLGIPFVASALLIDKLKGAFDFIKRNYKTVNLISGLLLIALGLLTATGAINYIYSLL